MRPRLVTRAVLICAFLSPAGQALKAAQAMVSNEAAAQAIIARHCVSCHGAGAISGLDMRDRDKLLKGGTRGPAIVPGKPEESLIVQAVARSGALKMPPGRAALTAGEVTVLRKWISNGARWPSGELESRVSEPSWWSFQRPRRPALPRIANENQARNPIDLFVLQKIEQKHLRIAPPADKRTLIRRVYFDLIGLPPSPDEMRRDMADNAPDAYERLIERLLASPHYGERWGRHWLDVARYADSAGFETDEYFPNAWRYRDYVIKSFNEDKPFDRFVQEQIAGDELWPDNLDMPAQFGVPPEKLEHLEAKVGTGFYTIGPEIGESKMDASKLAYERLTDAVDATGSAFLGLTLGCARCHDHKFDPIPQRDYFRMQAIFADSEAVQTPVVPKTAIYHRNNGYPLFIALDEARNAYRAFEEKIRSRVVQGRKAEFPIEVVRAFEAPDHKRTPKQREIAGPLLELAGAVKIEEHLTEEERREHQRLLNAIAKAVLDFPALEGFHQTRFDGFFEVPTATVLGHIEPELAPEVHILHRGDLGRKTRKADAGLPSAIADSTDFGGPGRKREKLALWLTRPDHPFTARVMVNRIWQWHFGRALVSTPNDFGRQGQPPSHPELLDWLATEFVERGWSIKEMHRLILTSNTYRAASQFTDAENSRVDPDNIYLWRMNRRRLEAEILWDTIHAAAGSLNLKMGGRPVAPPLSKTELAAVYNGTWPTVLDPEERNRRGVYILTRRVLPFPMFERFDTPESSSSCPRRDVTTVAPQALWMLNSQVMQEQARELARALAARHEGTAERVDDAWNRALGRSPTAKESAEALAMIERLTKKGLGSDDALAQIVLAIFNLNEFAYVD